MSWSISVIGKRDNILKHLDTYGDKLTSDSKKEYESCKSMLQDAVSLNYNLDHEGPALKLTAWGSMSQGLSSFGITLVYADAQLV